MKTKKILALALAAVLLVAVTVVGTMAYLVDSTEAVTNTFTATGIDITLDETSDNSFELIPGKKYTKNPVVEVEAETDVDIWLYVEITDESAKQYLSAYDCTLYEGETGANGWTKGDGVNIPANVYYREVVYGAATNNCTETTDACNELADPHWHLIADDTITVSADLVKAGTTTEGALVMPATGVKLEYKAYAIQSETLTASEGWAQLNPTNP